MDDTKNKEIGGNNMNPKHVPDQPTCKRTATEITVLENAKYATLMNWKMAKALVEGKVSSHVLRWAENIYHSQKDIFEEKE